MNTPYEKKLNPSFVHCNHRFVNLPEYSKMDEKVISYCGLWCNDCIPSRKDFFSLADSFDEMLKDLQFEHYANLKSEVTKEFGDYPAFLSVLHRIRELRCPGPCRPGGGKHGCIIRQCAKDKDFTGCWHCPTRRECGHLDRLRTIHPYIDYHSISSGRWGLRNGFRREKSITGGRLTKKRIGPGISGVSPPDQIPFHPANRGTDSHRLLSLLFPDRPGILKVRYDLLENNAGKGSLSFPLTLPYPYFPQSPIPTLRSNIRARTGIIAST